MKCQLCGKEMKCGQIISRRQMFRTDESGEKSLIQSNSPEWAWRKVNAYRCDDCSAFVIKDETDGGKAEKP